MNNRLLVAALAALLPLAPAVQAQDSTSRAGGYFVTTPGPRGTTRWVPTSAARDDARTERSSRGWDARSADTSDRGSGSQPDRTTRVASACDCPMMGKSSAGMMCAAPMRMGPS